MATTNTVLSNKDLRLLEDVVIQHGKTVTAIEVKQSAGGRYSDQELRNKLAKLTKQGWLVRLKRGQYLVITDISSLGYSDTSDYVIAQTLNDQSYISFENALQYRSMFDQRLASVDSVTEGRTRSYEVENNKVYRFSHIKRELYFGFEQVRIEGRLLNIAETEKALLDMLYFRSNAATTSLVLEKLRDYRHQIDFKRLKYYAKRYSLTIVREVGVLLDTLGIDTEDLHKIASVKGNTYSRMFEGADTFNAKWRIYNDTNLTHQSATTSDK